MRAKTTLVSEVHSLKGVGPATRRDLERLGIETLAQLRASTPEDLYLRLCQVDRAVHDVCVRDVFSSLVDQARGLPARPWWIYSRRRLAPSGSAPQAPHRGPRR